MKENNKNIRKGIRKGEVLKNLSLVTSMKRKNIFKKEVKNLNYMTLYKLQDIVKLDEFSDIINPKKKLEQELILKNSIAEFMLGEISWGEFSTRFSKSAYLLNRHWTNCESDPYSLGICTNDCDLDNLPTSAEPIAYRIHIAWIQAYKIAKRLTELNYDLIGTNADKVQSQEKLLCSYDELSREEQLKDIYVFKGFLMDSPDIEPNTWEKFFSTDEIEKGFIKYNINW